jgi:hypothetical protein
VFPFFNFPCKYTKTDYTSDVNSSIALSASGSPLAGSNSVVGSPNLDLDLPLTCRVLSNTHSVQVGGWGVNIVKVGVYVG